MSAEAVLRTCLSAVRFNLAVVNNPLISQGLGPDHEAVETRPEHVHTGTAIELFAGGGGLAVGVEEARFRHVVMNEYDARSCVTLRANGARNYEPGMVADRPLIEGDCHDIDWNQWRGQVDLLAGGPPCQPFSIGGVHRGQTDHRNLFPEAIRALDELRPRAIFLENVRGLARASFRAYFDYILLQLRVPHLRPKPGQHWHEHQAELERQVKREPPRSRYELSWMLVNAADYGVPQLRWRILIVGFRADLGVEWRFPAATHSRRALVAAQESGTYWSEHGIETPPSSRGPRLAVQDDRQRWRTVRDALKGLPEPVDGQEHPGFHNHVGIPGARLYTGHSGSNLDWPAKSVKAGVHGCPGGEHILVRPDDSYRYWTVRETARIQGFPDSHQFAGPRSEAMRQIGNAVPVPLARLIAEGIARELRTTVHAIETPTPAQGPRSDGYESDDVGRAESGLES
jgi:DNA (cytosine-5)-methyltransferase 1